MGQFDLDKYFRSRIKNHSDEMDTDALWTALDLEEKEKDRGLIFWWSGGLIAILFIAGIAFFYLSDNKEEQALPPDIATRVEKLEESVNATALKLESIMAESAIPNSKELLSNQSTPSDKINETRQSVKQIFNRANNKNSFNSNNQSSMLPPSVRKEVYPGKIEQDPITQTRPNFTSQGEKTPFTNSDELEVNENSIRGMAQLARIPVLNIKPIPVDMQWIPNPVLASEDIKPLQSNNSMISLNVFGDYSLLQRDLKVVSSIDIDPWITARDNSESLLQATALGAEFRYQLRSGLYAKLGIEYQRINEKFTWQTQRIDTITIENTITTQYVSAQNDTTFTFGSSLGTKTIDQNWISYNHHRFINLPVSLGYEIKRGPWSLFAEGSFHLNLSRTFSGEQLDGGLSVNSDTKYSRPKQNYRFSAGIGYQMTPSLYVYVQPHYQSLTIKTAEIEQRYKLYGLRLGIGYML